MATGGQRLGGWFQSHAGSIEAGWPGCGGSVAVSFQSHAGSIEARDKEMDQPRGYVGFNPTLVRLRHVIGAVTGLITSLFQSHAGSIEASHSW